MREISSPIPSPNEMNLFGKTYLVTGSTDGIGRHTVTQLARHDASVIVHGR